MLYKGPAGNLEKGVVLGGLPGIETEGVRMKGQVNRARDEGKGERSLFFGEDWPCWKARRPLGGS